MTRAHIGGQLTLEALEKLSGKAMPATIGELFGEHAAPVPDRTGWVRGDYQRAARGLQREGLGVDDVARALNLTRAAVRELLEEAREGGRAR